MPKLLTYSCPSCEGRTREWDDEPAPRFCSHCGFDSEPMSEQLAAPYISSPAARSVDQITRAHEQGAEFRAQMAMEQFGLDPAEAALMKMTDQKDNLREGDIAAVPVPMNSPVMQAMEANPGAFGYQAPTAALGASGLVRQGPLPNQGLKTMMIGREIHAGALAGAGHAGSVSSELPALEVFSPMYSPRVGGTRPGVGRSPPRRRLP